MVTKVRTVEFLPEIFRTETNRQFLNATLDILTAQPNLQKIQGYIGNAYGYGVDPTDNYISEPTTARANYQLDPSVIFCKPDTQQAQDYISYPGLVQALSNAGAIVNNESRLFESEFYSWDPFIDLDKIVNYAQYYWIPRGPDPITLTGSINITASILGQSTYTSPNGIVFTNGLKVTFTTGASPSEYIGRSYYVDGVGSSITLLPVDAYIVPEPAGESIYNPLDASGYDIDNYDVDLYISQRPDYITISRNSLTYNAWSRSNRWFHQSVLDTTISALGRVTSITENTPTRALRPIIEFRGNLQLFNSGSVGISPINLLDTSTSNISAIIGASSYTIDGITLTAGDRILLANADTVAMRQNVYTVSFTGPPTAQVIVLTLDTTVSPIASNTQLAVTSGLTYGGTSWRFDGVTGTWVVCQQKTTINQAPLFDVFTASGVSFGDSSLFPGTSFVGSKLFSYTPNPSGVADSVLGFALTYSGVNNIGDISFSVNLNEDTFVYLDESGVSTTAMVNSGYVHENTSISTYNVRTGWIPAADASVQYQVFTYTATADNQTVFVLDVPAKTTGLQWAALQIYVGETLLSRSDYSINLLDQKTITLSNGVSKDTVLTVLVVSDTVNSDSYYTIPNNLGSNPFNVNISRVDVGDLRNQYRTIYANVPNVVGPVFGSNNIQNLGSILQYGTAIIQNSASLVLPGLFLRKPDVDFFAALDYVSKQYQAYKDLIVDIAGKNDYSIQQTPQEILDSIIYEITTIRSNSASFFWTDMLPSGSPLISKVYSVGTAVSTATYNLSRIYDYSSANYYGCSVYLTRVINGIERQRQLLRGIEYTVSANTPMLTVNTALAAGDKITIKEYNQTYGSYCPSTPTSLGLYPATVPSVVLDSSGAIPAYYIVGHDGSWNKLYGSYVNGQLDDFRDIALLEFETRVYNNIKIETDIPLLLEQIKPGQFRTTDYSYSEYLDVYRTQYLNWVGVNKVDYRTQAYNGSNQFTYNYNQSGNVLSGNTALLQGYWRGIYKHFYDTENPSTTPWEMLGHASKPTWWGTYYSWTDPTKRTALINAITLGRTQEPPSTEVDPLYARPGFASVIPVNSAGTLLSPLVSVVGNYNSLSFNARWVVGDGSPVESTYWRSSQWAFDAMRIMALTKPAKFFNLMADRDEYKYDSTLQQYLYAGRYHLDPRQLSVYGSGTAKHSYINWIVDYIAVRGVDGQSTVSQYLRNLDVRLTHAMAGFTSKNQLKFYIERATPNSKNTSLLIPDENYSVLLYNNVPEQIIRYSSIVIQRVENGYAIYGNSTIQNYFSTLGSIPNGVTQAISAAGVTIKVAKTFNDTITIVPYGTVYYSVQAVCDFIAAYGNYLSTQGIKFENIYNDTVYDWNRIIEEFLVWSQQGWSVGSTIALNPNAKQFVVNSDGLVVQPLTITDKNFVLNQNLLPVQQQNSIVYRENTKFTVKILNDGDTISYTNLHLNSIEHAVVFDNVTSFDDVIYNLETGLRQNRIVLKGYKTAEWNGHIDANGFILSEDNIAEWTPNAKYAKGSIVLHKDRYWVATQLIEPSTLFVQSQWQSITYDRIKLGMLPNSSTQSAESLLYYNSNVANLELDADALSFGLIGYRPRDYLASADLTDITQVNIFKNILREKGTAQLANSFKMAKFDQGVIDYDIYENWAINTAEFGAVLSSNYVEATLDESQLIGNPTIVGFSQSEPVNNAQQTVYIDDLINWGRPPSSADFLPDYSADYSMQRGLPSAGYVHKDDPKFSVYKYSDLQADSSYVDNYYVNDLVWIANTTDSWNIYGGVSANSTVIGLENNLNGTATFIFNSIHNLEVGDEFMVTSFNTNCDGYYVVKSVKNIFAVTVEAVLSSGILKLSGRGVAIVLRSRRYAQASDIAATVFPYLGLRSRKTWVDYMSDNSWAVLQCDPVYNRKIWSPSINAGTALGYSSKLGYLFGNSSTSTVYLIPKEAEVNPTVLSTTFDYTDNAIVDDTVFDNNVTVFDNAGFIGGATTLPSPGQGFGKVILVVDSYVYIATQTSVAVYQIEENTSTLLYTQLLSQLNATEILALAASSDGRWLYTLSNVELRVYVRQNTGEYALVNTLASNGATSLQCSVDGTKVVVGFPATTSATLQAAGVAHVYARGLQRYYVTTSQTAFTLLQTPASNIIQVYVNGTAVTNYTYVNNVVTFSTAPSIGSIITVEYGNLELQQVLQSTFPRIGGNFGRSVATNRYGSDIVVGAPYEITSINRGTTEGAVYKFTNSGQRYGTVSCSGTVLSGDTLYINGYAVRYSTATSDLDSIAAQINAQTPTNIVATVADNTITIGVNDSSVETLYNIVDVVASVDVLSRLGITPYVSTQRITSYNAAQRGAFGYNVVLNERDVLLVSAPTTKKIGAVTLDYEKNIVATDSTVFDYTDNDINDDTVFDDAETVFDSGPEYGELLLGDGTLFDNDTTAIIDELPDVSSTTFDYTEDGISNDTLFDWGTTLWDAVQNIGMVYQYDYLPAANENITNTGQYVFGQYLLSYDSRIADANFGASLACKDGIVLAGTFNLSNPTSANVHTFYSTTTASSWSIDKQSIAAVDIQRISNVSLYNVQDNTTLQFLDYCDPYQGKLLGAIETNLDYIGSSDPAGYENNKLQWGEQQVGTTWFDTTNYRLLNTHQPDIAYNAKYWGVAFPGSTTDVYTWIKSTVSPLEYNGRGIVTDYENYVITSAYVPATNSIATFYYFWVKNYDALPAGKTLSPVTVSSYLLNPLTSGISFLAPLSTNSIAMYNCSNYIRDTSTVLHLGYGSTVSTDVGHTKWELLQSNKSESFLSGFPRLLSDSPRGLYLKYIDSFCGFDSEGFVVPDTRLPPILRSGVGFRPRQTMFMNRGLALKNFIKYANSVAKKYPIRETVNLNYLNKYNDVNGGVEHSAVRAATTVPIIGSYSNGIYGEGATLSGSGSLPAIDSVALAVGDRILVKNQTAAIENGIYVVNSIGPITWQLTRALDFNGTESGFVQFGDTVPVRTGLTLANTIWMVATQGNITFGLNPVTFITVSNSQITNNSAPIYDTRNFWEYTDWWADGYDSSTKPVLEVAIYSDLLKISQNTIITGVNGLLLTLTDGLIVRVKSNSQGLSETYSYNATTNSWVRIGLQQGTVQISDTLWSTVYGFDWTSYSADNDSFEKDISTETRWIIRWINEYLFSEELLSHRNSSLMLMFNYIKSEALNQLNYGQWLQKTSFIDVSHTIRQLTQYKNYQRDNTEFLTGFINEVKPYHVVIKDFIYKYTGIDTANVNSTDFDLPARYNSNTGKFETPQLVYAPTYENNQYTTNSTIWNDPLYAKWFENWGLQYDTDGALQNYSYLRTAIDATQTVLTLHTVIGLEPNGVLRIDNEDISYSGINRTTRQLLNLVRGYAGTTASAHSTNVSVSLYTTPIMVLDGARGYSTVPTITITNPAGYPAPRTTASAVAVLGGPGGVPGSVSRVELVTAGSGYAVEPNIKISSSPINGTFVGANVNTTNNTITITNHTFLTGDPVVFTSANNANIYGLKNDAYYYVTKIDSNTIALYYDLYAAQEAGLPNLPFPQPPRKRATADEERVKLSATGSIVGTLAVTARLTTYMSSGPLRTFKTTIVFDRVSTVASPGTQYTAAERIQQYYSPTVNMPGNDLSQLMSGVEYPNTIVQGTVFDQPNVVDVNIDPSPAANFVNPTGTFDLSGGEFAEGYAPEELVPNIVTDSLQIRVTSDDLQPLNGIGYITSLSGFTGTISGSLPIYTNQRFENLTITGGSGSGARANVTLVVMPGALTIQGPGTSNQNVYVELVYPNTAQNYRQYQVNDVVTISGTQLGGTSPANDLVMVVTSVGGRTWSYVQTVNRFGLPMVYAGTTTSGAQIDMNYYDKNWYGLPQGWNADGGWNEDTLPWDSGTTPDCSLTVSQHPVAVFLRNNQ